MPLKIEIKKYVRKLFYVDVVEVTAENMEGVADWCKGEVRTEVHTNDTKGRTTIDKYVKVRVHRALNDRQTKAYVGDRILFAGSGFKVYTGKAFDSNFEKAEPQKLVQLEDNQSVDMLQPQPLQELFITAERA